MASLLLLIHRNKIKITKLVKEMRFIMRNLIVVIITIFAMFLSACYSTKNEIITNFPDKEKIKDFSQEKINKQVQGNNRFAWKLYKNLSKSPNENIFFSPYSISTALAMAYAGARKETAEEMKKTLEFYLSDNELHQAFSVLLDTTKGNSNYDLTVANALWGQKDYNFLTSFLETTGKNYGAGLHEVNFAGAPDESRLLINKWVENNTNNKIQDLLKPGSITPITRLVLTNAIHFKAKWAKSFHKSNTVDEDFHGLKGKTTVKMMKQTETLEYLEDANIQAVQLPYKGDDLTMLVILPKHETLEDWQKNIDFLDIAKIARDTIPVKVELSLPKFKLTNQFSLAKNLVSLGMNKAFQSQADFSGINGKHDLFINDVIHKAFIDVDEKGTEAAAATAIVYKSTSAQYPNFPIEKVKFEVDRPFMYCILHKESNSILFMGRVTKPVIE